MPNLRLILSVCLAISLGCSRSPDSLPNMTLATTTSTQDSGLLEALVPMFERQTGIDVKVVAVGSGQALELGRRGDADVLLVHSPAAEEQFMDKGFGEARHPVMHNDFVLVGPLTDPAGVKGETSIKQSFAKIASSKSLFVSRGDESGTHKKEQEMWREAGVEPAGDWYISAGAGMGQILRLASEKRAYTLTDRGTFLAQKAGLDVAILSEGDSLLRNPYSVIVVSSAMHPGVNCDAARRFAQFLMLPEGQTAIGEFGVDKFGQPLFFPNRDNVDRKD